MNTHKDIFPLLSAKIYAESRQSIIIDQIEIEDFINSFGPVLKVDKDWKNSLCYPTPYIAKLTDVVIIPGSRILLTAEGPAVSDEIEIGYREFGLRPKIWEMEISKGPNLNLELPNLAIEHIDCGIHLTGEHETNYFHWLVELLPRLYLYEQLMPDKEIPLLVSDGLHRNLYDMISALCSPNRGIKKLHKGIPYEIGTLMYPSDMSRILDVYDRAPDYNTTYLPVNLLKYMAQTVKSKLDPVITGYPKRLFIKRSSDYRKLLNQEEIEKMLKRKGFYALDPGRLSIKEQVHIFSQAEVIVGPSGAALANIIWCQEGAKIIILHSDHPYKKYPYWDALARSSGVHISYLSGPRANNVTGYFQTHDDFEIDPAIITRTLKKFGKSNLKQLIRSKFPNWFPSSGSCSANTQR